LCFLRLSQYALADAGLDPVRCRRSVTLLPTVTRRVFVTCPFVRKRVTDGEIVTVRLEPASPDRSWPASIVQHPVLVNFCAKHPGFDRFRTKVDEKHQMSGSRATNVCLSSRAFVQKVAKTVDSAQKLRKVQKNLGSRPSPR
jgi:hypothetical protein